MNDSIIYTIFGLSLTGIVSVFVSKMAFFETILKKKDMFLRSKYGQNSEQKNAEKITVNKETNFNYGSDQKGVKENSFIKKIVSFFKNIFDKNKKIKLNKIAQDRLEKMQEMEEEQVFVEDDGELGFNKKTFQSLQAQTVKPIKRTKNKEKIEIKETFLINKVAKKPQDKENYRVLGDFYLKYGKIDDAKECFRHILKIDISDEYSQEQLERLNELH